MPNVGGPNATRAASLRISRRCSDSPNPGMSNASGPPIDVLAGFVNAEGKAYGRPVGVVIERRGALLVADDVGNIIWRVTSAGAK